MRRGYVKFFLLRGNGFRVTLYIMSKKTDENGQAHIDALVTQLCEGLTQTATNPKAGNKPIEYWHIPIGNVSLLGELAEARGKLSDYLQIVQLAFDNRLKTAQTTTDENNKRTDTLTLEEKRDRANAFMQKLYTVQESEATRTKRAMKSVAALVVELQAAQAAGDLDAVARISQEMQSAMTA